MNMYAKHTMAGFIAFVLLLIVSCSAEKSDESDIRVIELMRKNEHLNTELKLLTETLSELQDAQQGFVTQQVVGEPVKYQGAGRTLEDVQNRKVLRCGGNADLPGFGYLDPDSSSFVGFDIDFCRAIAAAVLGEDGSDQIEIIPLTSKLRFASLQSGNVDVLTRNTTWTMTRDTEMRANYTGVTFYDGQGVLVRKKDNIKTISDLRDKSVCVQSGSTSVTNAENYFDELGIDVVLEAFDQRVAAMNHYDEAACEGYTGDKSSLAAQRILLAKPNDHTLLHKEISREPLGPLVRHNDDNWQDIVRWTLQCMFNGEFYELSKQNIAEQSVSDPDFVNTVLGVSSQLGSKIGLSDDFCLHVIKQVGNYKDVYDRHLGPDTPFELPRGLNALYVDGGLHYPLPLK